MKIDNPLYKNQGIHVDIAVFTVRDRKVETLLVKRAIDQFVGEWIIPGGAVYNNESLDTAAQRELAEKTGLQGIYIKQFKAFGDPKRDPRKRMVSIAYLALVDYQRVSLLQRAPKTAELKWFDIKNVPRLAFDHNQILIEATAELKNLISKSNIAKSLLPKLFTLPEIQEAYEIILGHELDRRNFRRKLLATKVIEPTGRKAEGNASRPANLYRFSRKDYCEVNIV